VEVLRQARMPEGLQFVLILPDGSKSLIPADWTDFPHPAGAAPTTQLVAWFEDLLRLRDLTDALRHRTGWPLPSGASQEGHATTASELQPYSDSRDAPVGRLRRRAKTRRPRNPLAPSRPSNAGPPAGADQGLRCRKSKPHISRAPPRCIFDHPHPARSSPIVNLRLAHTLWLNGRAH
jgi:hypothetical protein